MTISGQSMNIIDNLMDNMDDARRIAQSSQQHFNQAISATYTTLNSLQAMEQKNYVSHEQLMAYTT